MNRKKFLLLLVFLASTLGIALGFNTIDAMMWNFYNTSAWKTWFPDQWQMNTYLHVEVWNAYFLFGILPLIGGSIALGYALRVITRE